MDTGAIVIIIVVGVILLLVFYGIGVYNKLVNARNKVNDQFSQIDVQLKRRVDLIPNLVETVKGYAKHEEKTLTEVIEARNKMATASGINEELEASNQVTAALNKLFALSEAYPDLSDAGIVKLVIPVPEKAFAPIDSIPSGSSISLRFSQPENALFPIVLTVLGIFIFSIVEHPKKLCCGIIVAPSAKVTSFTLDSSNAE